METKKLKIIVVCSYRKYAAHTNGIAPFIYEQVIELQKFDCEFHFVLVRGGGAKAYLSAYKNLLKEIKLFQPHIIHAHGGLCALMANFQRITSVISTYHGSDINEKATRFFSKIAIKLSKHNIFVSQKLIDIARPKKNFDLIPCGVDIQCFTPMDKTECRKKLHFDLTKIYILFSKSFNVKVKNYPLAKAAVSEIENAELVELKGFTREKVNLLFNACDVALLTSFTEGSPQFVKEAMAVNCPIVSTDVGDVQKMIENVRNCYITSYEFKDVADKLKLCLQNDERSNGREILQKMNLDNQTIAKEIINIYKSIIYK